MSRAPSNTVTPVAAGVDGGSVEGPEHAAHNSSSTTTTALRYDSTLTRRIVTSMYGP